MTQPKGKIYSSVVQNVVKVVFVKFGQQILHNFVQILPSRLSHPFYYSTLSQFYFFLFRVYINTYLGDTCISAWVYRNTSLGRNPCLWNMSRKRWSGRTLDYDLFSCKSHPGIRTWTSSRKRWVDKVAYKSSSPTSVRSSWWAHLSVRSNSWRLFAQTRKKCGDRTWSEGGRRW